MSARPGATRDPERASGTQSAPPSAREPAAVGAPEPSRGPAAGTAHEVKRLRQRAIRQLIAGRPIGSQLELVGELRALGFDVTQATVSRDMAELGLVKMPRADGHVYVAREDLAQPPSGGRGERLRRLLADIPVTVGRSGLTLVLTATPGMASAIAQAIDESGLTDQEGTLAGDNTLLVLFSDEPRLERWLRNFREIQSLPAPPARSEVSP